MADTSSMDQLRRFLYFGDESKSYPECISFPFQSEKIESLFDAPNALDVIREITRAYRDNFYLGPEPIIFSLAKFAHSTEEATREAALKAVRDICLTPTAMFLFAHIYKELSKPVKGWSWGFRKFFCYWYNSKEARELVADVTKMKSYQKWTHKDILCMAHVKPEKIGNAAVLKYLVKGYEEAEKEFSSEPDAEPVLKYLRAVTDLNRASNGEVAARLLEINDLCLEQIPSHLLKTKEVALCVIPRVPVKSLLSLLPIFCKLGFLKLNSPHYKALLERLNSEEALTDGSIDPLESFLAIRKWQLSNQVLPGRSIVRQNTPAIYDSLQNLHLASFKSVIPTQKRYLIAVDIRPGMSQSSCFHSKNISPSNVSEIVLLALVKAELANVTVLVFSPDELVSVDINNKMSISDVNEHIAKAIPGPVNLSAPLQWALTKKKSYDLFIVFSDVIGHVDPEGCTAAFKEYKQTLHLPNTRFMLCTLGESKYTSFEDPDMLNIVGFNIKLLKIIQDFTCGKF